MTLKKTKIRQTCKKVKKMINNNNILKALLYTSKHRRLKEACEQLKHVDDREEYYALIDEIYKCVSLLDAAVLSEIPDKR